MSAAGVSPWLAHYDPGVPATLKPYPERTLLYYLSETVRTRPDHPVLLFKGRPMSATELDTASNAFAAALTELGVKKGDRVALCLPNCPQFIIAQYGAWKAGAIVCPINPTYTAREMTDALTTTGAETIVALNRFYALVKSIQDRTSLRRVIATGIKEHLPPLLRIAYTLLKERKDGERVTIVPGDERFAGLLARHRGAVSPQFQPKPNDPAAILMSGGTTGTPKGVLGLHRNMVIAGLQLQRWLGSTMLEWTDSLMVPLPLFHTFTHTGAQSLALINHNPLVLIPNPRDLKDLLQQINRVRPAFICAVPTLLNGIMNHPLARAGKVNFRSIKLCFCGATALMAETKKRFEEATGGVIVEGYSLTEAQMAVVANPARGEKKIGSVGMPLPDVRVGILDSEDGTTPKPLGAVGEIVITAPQLMEGYWQRPDETREMLREDENGERALYTGDLGYLDDDGYLFIVDRKKDLIKTSGYQVWPREIEEVISTHPAVAEVGVVGLPDEVKGERVKAWIVPRPGATVNETELKAFCRERLAPYKVPSEFAIVTDLPKTQVGKVLRRALKERELERLAAR
ncbi:MAG TPA: AMP-binding protein [Gemmatimonadaceae bacterium]|jgi:long-chain acyl-CoA synthetase|nr:AMP-binding protein [Gemmatimonadaceae bacterium]